MVEYPITTEYEHITVTEAMVPMPDGVRLYTRYTVPRGAKKCPIVYIRTPYEKSHNGEAHHVEGGGANSPYAKRGYAVLTQHCRGRGDSEGECIPYREREDGLATLAFIRSLPFYNGEIYVMGGSYLATVHLSYLADAPNDIKGACLQVQTDRMYYRNYVNGCNYKLNNAGWWGEMLKRSFPTQNYEHLSKRPYVDAAKRIFGADVPAFTDRLIHNTCDDFWTSDSRWYAMEQLKIPTLLVEGWYDFYIDGMMNMWERIPEATKARSAMLIGPYGHAVAVSDKAEYPLAHGNIPSDFILEWFDSLRKNRPYAYAELGKITYYTIGADDWRSEAYPRKDADTQRFFFGRGGALSSAPPRGEGEAITYRYDPEETGSCYKFHDIYRAHPAGSVPGVLSFLSEPFEKEERFFGKVTFHLNVSSDCEDTAFFMRLYFVENGESYNLTETVGSLSHFISDYTPGRQVSIELDTPPIAFAVRPGMQLRVDISSKSGVYLPHANVKGHFAYVKEKRVAHNTFFTDRSYIDIRIQ